MARPKKASAEHRQFKTISLDTDLVELLNATADKLVNQFGFRPTLSQTMRHLLKDKVK